MLILSLTLECAILNSSSVDCDVEYVSESHCPLWGGLTLLVFVSLQYVRRLPCPPHPLVCPILS